MEGPVREVFLNLDVLRRTRLEPPSVFQLFALMAERGIASPKTMPLTVEEALVEIKKIVQHRASSAEERKDSHDLEG